MRRYKGYCGGCCGCTRDTAVVRGESAGVHGWGERGAAEGGVKDIFRVI